MTGLTVLTLMVNAPLCAVVEGDDATVHAAELEAIADAGYGNEPLKTACGKVGHLALYSVDTPTLWPPRVAELKAAGGVRCMECHQLTGRKRPRSVIKAKQAIG